MVLKVYHVTQASRGYNGIILERVTEIIFPGTKYKLPSAPKSNAKDALQ